MLGTDIYICISKHIHPGINIFMHVLYLQLWFFNEQVYYRISSVVNLVARSGGGGVGGFLCELFLNLSSQEVCSIEIESPVCFVGCILYLLQSVEIKHYKS